MPTTCLLCPAEPVELGPETPVEHPILDSLGGRLQSRKLICGACNSRLGATIDGALAEELELIRHALRIFTGSGGDPPTLRGLKTEHGAINLGPTRGTVAKPSMKEVPSADVGGRSFVTECRTFEEAATMAAHAARRAGIKAVDNLRAHLVFSSPEIALTRNPLSQPIQRTMVFGPRHFRSIAKSALEIYAIEHPEEARGESFRSIRHFINDANAKPDLVRWQFGTNVEVVLPFTDEELGNFWHSVAIWGHPGSLTVAQVVLFGHLPFLVRLGDSWPHPEPRLIAHAVEPLDGRRYPIRSTSFCPPPVDASIFEPSLIGPDSGADETMSAFGQRVQAAQSERYAFAVARETILPLLTRLRRGELVTPEEALAASEAFKDAIKSTQQGTEVRMARADFVEMVVAEFERLAKRDATERW